MKKIEDLLVKSYGRLFSEELGIDLGSKKESETFKWFLASILFGARINETIAKNTYKALIRHNLTTPRKILMAGWYFLVKNVMGEGGYVRYDGVTSQYLIDICKKLIKDYNGKVTNIFKAAKDSKDLERRLLEFRGIGPVTVNIFLRELRGIWKKADPELGKLASLAARNLGIKVVKNRRIEAALTRIGKDYCRRKKCNLCPFRKFCKNK